MQLKDIISREEFEKMYSTMTITEMAKILKVSRQTVITQAKNYGLKHKTAGGYKPTKTIKISKEELERLYTTTKTTELAKNLGVCVATLVRIIKENGIKVKSPGWGIRPRKIVVEG